MLMQIGFHELVYLKTQLHGSRVKHRHGLTNLMFMTILSQMLLVSVVMGKYEHKGEGEESDDPFFTFVKNCCGKKQQKE